MGVLWGFYVCSMVCCAVLCVLSSFAIILVGKRELVALLCLSSRWLVAVSVLWLCFTVPWDGLRFVIVVFFDQNHLLLLRKFVPQIKLRFESLRIYLNVCSKNQVQI